MLKSRLIFLFAISFILVGVPLHAKQRTCSERAMELAKNDPTFFERVAALRAEIPKFKSVEDARHWLFPHGPVAPLRLETWTRHLERRHRLDHVGGVWSLDEITGEIHYRP